MAQGRIIRQGRRELSGSSTGGVTRNTSSSSSSTSAQQQQTPNISLFGTSQAPNTAVITRADGTKQYVTGNQTIAVSQPYGVASGTSVITRAKDGSKEYYSGGVLQAVSSPQSTAAKEATSSTYSSNVKSIVQGNMLTGYEDSYTKQSVMFSQPTKVFTKEGQVVGYEDTENKQSVMIRPTAKENLLVTTYATPRKNTEPEPIYVTLSSKNKSVGEKIQQGSFVLNEDLKKYTSKLPDKPFGIKPPKDYVPSYLINSTNYEFQTNPEFQKLSTKEQLKNKYIYQPTRSLYDVASGSYSLFREEPLTALGSVAIGGAITVATKVSPDKVVPVLKVVTPSLAGLWVGSTYQEMLKNQKEAPKLIGREATVLGLMMLPEASMRAAGKVEEFKLKLANEKVTETKFEIKKGKETLFKERPDVSTNYIEGSDLKLSKKTVINQVFKENIGDSSIKSTKRVGTGRTFEPSQETLSTSSQPNTYSYTSTGTFEGEPYKATTKVKQVGELIEGTTKIEKPKVNIKITYQGAKPSLIEFSNKKGVVFDKYESDLALSFKNFDLFEAPKKTIYSKEIEPFQTNDLNLAVKELKAQGVEFKQTPTRSFISSSGQSAYGRYKQSSGSRLIELGNLPRTKAGSKVVSFFEGKDVPTRTEVLKHELKHLEVANQVKYNKGTFPKDEEVIALIAEKEPFSFSGFSEKEYKLNLGKDKASFSYYDNIPNTKVYSVELEAYSQKGKWGGMLDVSARDIKSFTARKLQSKGLVVSDTYGRVYQESKFDIKKRATRKVLSKTFNEVELPSNEILSTNIKRKEIVPKFIIENDVTYKPDKSITNIEFYNKPTNLMSKEIKQGKYINNLEVRESKWFTRETQKDVIKGKFFERESIKTFKEEPFEKATKIKERGKSKYRTLEQPELKTKQQTKIKVNIPETNLKEASLLNTESLLGLKPSSTSVFLRMPRIRTETNTNLSSRIRTENRTEIRPEIKLEIKPVIKTEIRPSIMTEIKPVIKTEIRPRLRTEVRTDIKSDIGSGYSFQTFTPYVPPVSPPTTSFSFGSGGFGFGRIGKSKKQPKAYNPTLYSAVFKIRGKSSKAGVISGLGIRPI